MSAILYKLVDKEVVKETVKATEVANLIENHGYKASPEELKPKPKRKKAVKDEQTEG